MENNQIKKEFITRLKGEYQAKYGFEMDEWTAIILYEVSENFVGFKRIVERSKLTIDKATEQIKGQVTPIHFNSPKEAFRYGLGQAIGLAGSVSLAVCFMASLIFWVQITSSEYQDKLQLLKEYEDIEQFRLLSDGSRIIKKNGVRYLVLKANHKSNDLRIGQEYTYKPKLKEVWVPLGR